MKHFKHLKPGMSLIEVIAAIAILAIFGTSLFLMQQFLFDRMMMTQRKVIAALRMQKELVTYQTNILKELLEESEPLEKSLQDHVQEYNHPDMSVTITTQADLAAKNEDSLLKQFKNLYVMSSKAQQDTTEYGKSYVFVYIPEVAKK